MNTQFKRVLGWAAVTAATLTACVAFNGCGGEEAAPTAPTTSPQTTTTVVTTTTHAGMMNGEVNVREGAGFDHASLGGIAVGSDVVIVGREGDWYKIEFGDGYGYVNAHYVDVDGSSNASQMVASRAPATTATTMKTTKPGQATTTTKPGQTTTTTKAAAGTTTSKTAAGNSVPTVVGSIPDTQANDAF